MECHRRNRYYKKIVFGDMHNLMSKPAFNAESLRVVEVLSSEPGKETLKTVALDESQSVLYLMRSTKLLDLSPEQLAEKMHSIRALSVMKHPNIIKCEGCWINEGTKQLCMLTEYPDDENMQIKIQEAEDSPEGRLEESYIRNIAFQIANALQYLHSNSNYHMSLDAKDIIFVGNTAKLGTIALNKRCLSEEKAGDHKVDDRKLDIWKLGCLIYSMCTGKLPFEDTEKTSSQVQSQEVNLNQIAEHFSEELLFLVAACLQGSEEKRPNASEILKSPAFAQIITSKQETMMKMASSQIMKQSNAQNIGLCVEGHRNVKTEKNVNFSEALQENHENQGLSKKNKLSQSLFLPQNYADGCLKKDEDKTGKPEFIKFSHKKMRVRTYKPSVSNQRENL